MFDSKQFTGDFLSDDAGTSNPFGEPSFETSDGEAASPPAFPPKSEALARLVRKKVPSRLKVLLVLTLFFVPLLVTEISTLLTHPQAPISACSLDGTTYSLETCFSSGVAGNCTTALSYDVFSTVLTADDVMFQVIFYLQFALLVLIMAIFHVLFFVVLGKSQLVLKLLPHRIYVGMRKTVGLIGLFVLLVLGAAYVLLKWKATDMIARDSAEMYCQGRTVYLRLVDNYFEAMFGLGKHLFVTLTVFLGAVKPLAERVWNLYVDLDLKTVLREAEGDSLQDIANIQKIEYNALRESIRECLEKKYPALSPAEVDQLCDISKISNEHMQLSLAHVRLNKPHLFLAVNA